MKNLKTLYLLSLIICIACTTSFAQASTPKSKKTQESLPTEQLCVKYINRADLVGDLDLAYLKNTLYQEFPPINEKTMNIYYLQFNKSWGNVAMALALSQATRTPVENIAELFDRFSADTSDWELWGKIINSCGAVSMSPSWTKLNVIIQRQLNIWD